MAYSIEEIEEKFALIIKDIEENNMPLRRAIKGYGMPDITTFYKWCDEDEEKSKRYVRACEARADNIFEEILEIADKQGEDVTGEDEYGNQIINHNVISRNRLQVDARKWIVAKMIPRKYGDKVDHTTNGKDIPATTVIQWGDKEVKI